MTDEHQLREIKKHFDSATDRVQRKWSDLFEKTRESAGRDIVVSVEWLVEHQGKKLEEQWDSGFGELQWAIDELRDEIRGSAERIERGVARGFAGVEEWLRRSVHVLERPRGTRALEFRREAEFARKQGWISEALDGFLAAEKLNYQDYKVHLNIGLLYRELREPGKALEYFGKAAKYARPHSDREAAAALWNAARVREEAGDVAGAYGDACEALRLHPTEVEIAYLHARLAARTGHVEEMLSSLQTVVRLAPVKAIEVRHEQAFAPHQARITALFERLRAETERRVHALLGSIAEAERELAQLDGARTEEITRTLDERWARVEAVLGKGTIVDSADAERVAKGIVTDAWMAVAEMCDVRQAALRAEEERLAAATTDARERARAVMSKYLWLGIAVFYVPLVILGLWSQLPPGPYDRAIEGALEAVLPDAVLHADTAWVVPIALAIGLGALGMSFLLARAAMRRARAMASRPHMREAERVMRQRAEVKEEIARLTAKKEGARRCMQEHGGEPRAQ